MSVTLLTGGEADIMSTFLLGGFVESGSPCMGAASWGLNVELRPHLGGLSHNAALLRRELNEQCGSWMRADGDFYLE